MSGFPYDLIDPVGPRLGLIVLQSDETIEEDFRRMFPVETQVFCSRIASGADVTPETLAKMAGELARSAALLPPGDYAAIGYGCTSGAMTIGSETVAEQMRAGRSAAHVTEPLSAARAAMAAVGMRSVAILSPYILAVAEPLAQAFVNGGIEVRDTLSFGEQTEALVARISTASVRAAALELADRTDADGLFLSCTNLRTFDVIAGIEAEIGKPVLSSNQVLAWHMARLSGAELSPEAPGMIFDQ